MGEYKIDKIHYCDKFGKLISESDMVFRRLHGPGEILILDSIKYEVIRTAVHGDVEVVNMVENPNAI